MEHLLPGHTQPVLSVWKTIAKYTVGQVTSVTAAAVLAGARSLLCKSHVYARTSVLIKLKFSGIYGEISRKKPGAHEASSGKSFAKV